MKIFLLGMMGSGKSYWAQRLSDKTNIDWIDLDAQIEKASSLTVKEIFETLGELYFRQKETEVLQELSNMSNLIIATGGGTPCFNNNMQFMNDHGTTVWIDEELWLLVERLKRGKEHRPLIKDLTDEQLQDFLAKKLAERLPFYEQAQYHLQGTQISDTNFTTILEKHA